jgi:U3 small nucleolar RNA-associated protein 4
MAQKQHFSAHKADGMCLLIGPNGKSVFSSGPDQRVCQFTYIASTNNFALTSTKRLHSHDVRALSIFPSYSPITTTPTSSDLAPVLVSGGYDMSLTFTPAASPSLLSESLRNPLGKGGMSRCVFDEAFTRKMGYLGDGRIGVSRGGRFVLGRKERSVGLWRVLGDESGWEKVLEMDLRVSPGRRAASGER